MIPRALRWLIRRTGSLKVTIVRESGQLKKFNVERAVLNPHRAYVKTDPQALSFSVSGICLCPAVGIYRLGWWMMNLFRKYVTTSGFNVNPCFFLRWTRTERQPWNTLYKGHIFIIVNNSITIMFSLTCFRVTMTAVSCCRIGGGASFSATRHALVV